MGSDRGHLNGLSPLPKKLAERCLIRPPDDVAARADMRIRLIPSRSSRKSTESLRFVHRASTCLREHYLTKTSMARLIPDTLGY